MSNHYPRVAPGPSFYPHHPVQPEWHAPVHDRASSHSAPKQTSRNKIPGAAVADGFSHIVESAIDMLFASDSESDSDDEVVNQNPQSVKPFDLDDWLVAGDFGSINVPNVNRNSSASVSKSGSLFANAAANSINRPFGANIGGQSALGFDQSPMWNVDPGNHAANQMSPFDPNLNRIGSNFGEDLNNMSMFRTSPVATQPAFDGQPPRPGAMKLQLQVVQPSLSTSPVVPGSIAWKLPSWLHMRFFETHGHSAITSRLPDGFVVKYSKPASIEFIKSQDTQVDFDANITAEDLRIVEGLVHRLATFGPLEVRTVTPYLSVTPLHADLVLKKLERREKNRKEMVIYYPDWSESGKLIRVLVLGPKFDVRKGRNEVRAFLQGTFHEQQLIPSHLLSALPSDYIDSLQTEHSVRLQSHAVDASPSSGNHQNSLTRVVIDSCCPFDARDAFLALRSMCHLAGMQHTGLSMVPLPAIWLVYVRDVVWPQWVSAGTSDVILGCQFMDARGQLSFAGPIHQIESLRTQVFALIERSKTMLTDVVWQAESYHTHDVSVFSTAVQNKVAVYVDSRSRSLQLLTALGNEVGMAAMRSQLASCENFTVIAEFSATNVTDAVRWLRNNCPRLRIDRRDSTLRVSGRRSDVEDMTRIFPSELGLWKNLS